MRSSWPCKAHSRSIGSAKGSPIDSSASRFRSAELADQQLLELSRTGQLALGLAEMKTIQRHFAELGRDPTDCELETLAQTWSEHCSHKTLRGRIAFQGRTIDNLLKQTIFRATHELGCDWLVSVFSDNAGVVRFDDGHDVCFKVETHNHPSAIDPYGGANTGLGGVIRDALGTGSGGQADLQHRCVLRGAARSAAGAGAGWRASSQARARGGRRRRPRLRQPDGDSHGQRGPGCRPGLPGQSACLLRDRGRVAARQVGKTGRAGRPDRRDRRPHRPRRHSRRDLQLGRADGAKATRYPAAPCRSATRSPKRWCST